MTTLKTENYVRLRKNISETCNKILTDLRKHLKDTVLLKNREMKVVQGPVDHLCTTADRDISQYEGGVGRKSSRNIFHVVLSKEGYL